MKWFVHVHNCTGTLFLRHLTKRTNYYNLKMESTIDTKQLHNTPEDFYGQEHTVSGLVKSCRKSSKRAFIVVTDGKSPHHLQVIVEKEGNEQLFASLEKCNVGSSITIVGTFLQPPSGKEKIEMRPSAITIYGNVGDVGTYPIAKKALSLDHLRSIPHIRQRTDKFAAITRISSTMSYAIEEYFRKNKVIKVQPTEITDNECESGANPFLVSTMLNSGDVSAVQVCADNKSKIDFSLDFFKKPCYLTVSSQLHLECLCTSLTSDVWCPTIAFRGEKSLTNTHVAEFLMIEWELAFSKLERNIAFAEGLIKHAFSAVLEENRSDLECIEEKSKHKDVIATLEKYINSSFAVTTHEECVRRMLEDVESGKVTFEELPNYDEDINKQHERYITEVLFGGLPVFVKYFPKIVKAFYMPVIDESTTIEHVDCYDLLLPIIGEIVGGSQRETDYDKLLDRMAEVSINPEKLSFYLDLRKYGTIPHGGAGLGFNRLVLAAITGSGATDTEKFTIKDTIHMPRYYTSCQF
jgi:asparaginyl-tRNA synthetase